MCESRRLFVATLILGMVAAAGWGCALASEGECRAAGQEADVRISALRPTQPNVGLGEVRKKAKKLQDSNPEQGGTDDGDPVPVVEGPDHTLYVADHHHFVLALNIAHPNALVRIRVIESDFCKNCSPSNPKCTDGFWTHMVVQHLAYLCNAQDQPLAFTALPPSFDLGASPPLQNDPYRTLVNVMRKTPPTGAQDPCVKRPSGGPDAFFWEFRIAEKIRRNIAPAAAADLVKRYSETVEIPQGIIDAACTAATTDASDVSCAQTIAAHPNLVVQPRH
jgi:hypothetical protein